ncbi:MAG TPA: aspartate kinase, partial [Bacillota bacterium]|nr:aspartate kinase [Bacillota bacterium]
MALIVQKFGGSSLASPDHIRRVACTIAATKKEGHQVVVVVSAMGGETDRLLALATEINPDKPARELDELLATG